MVLLDFFGYTLDDPDVRFIYEVGRGLILVIGGFMTLLLIYMIWFTEYVKKKEKKEREKNSGHLKRINGKPVFFPDEIDENGGKRKGIIPHFYEDSGLISKEDEIIIMEIIEKHKNNPKFRDAYYVNSNGIEI